MKMFKTLAFISTLATASAFAQSGTPRGEPKSEAKPSTSASASSDMTEGEVRKVDLENKKITLKHGDIKNLDMPGMTMVFQVKDPAMLAKVKAGDKVQFRAEKANGAIVVTDLQESK